MFKRKCPPWYCQWQFTGDLYKNYSYNGDKQCFLNKYEIVIIIIIIIIIAE